MDNEIFFCLLKTNHYISHIRFDSGEKMTFIITICVREGIVMASDSRLTFNLTQQAQNQQITQTAVIQSDTNYKTFLMQNKNGISFFGQAEINGVPISGFIENFINATPQTNVSQVPQQLLNYFRSLPGPPHIYCHIAGYEINSQSIPEQHVYDVNVFNNSFTRLQSPVAWGGESDILHRLIQPLWTRSGQPGNYSYDALPFYNIQFQLFTLQDAIDFSIYAIKATIDSMNFQPRPKTVGGPIDVLVIKPDRALFIQRKELHG